MTYDELNVGNVFTLPDEMIDNLCLIKMRRSSWNGAPVNGVILCPKHLRGLHWYCSPNEEVTKLDQFDRV